MASRYDQLVSLENKFEKNEISAEVTMKRSAQLLAAFRSDVPTRMRCAHLWNKARAAIRRGRSKA